MIIEHDLICKVCEDMPLYDFQCEMDLSHNCSLHGGKSEVCEKKMHFVYRRKRLDRMRRLVVRKIHLA